MCSKTLNRWQDVRRHMLSKHLGGGVHPCVPGCPKKYKRHDVLQRHEKGCDFWQKRHGDMKTSRKRAAAQRETAEPDVLKGQVEEKRSETPSLRFRIARRLGSSSPEASSSDCSTAPVSYKQTAAQREAAERDVVKGQIKKKRRNVRRIESSSPEASSSDCSTTPAIRQLRTAAQREAAEPDVVKGQLKKKRRNVRRIESSSPEPEASSTTPAREQADPTPTCKPVEAVPVPPETGPSSAPARHRPPEQPFQYRFVSPLTGPQPQPTKATKKATKQATKQANKQATKATKQALRPRTPVIAAEEGAAKEQRQIEKKRKRAVAVPAQTSLLAPGPSQPQTVWPNSLENETRIFEENLRALVEEVRNSYSRKRPRLVDPSPSQTSIDPNEISLIKRESPIPTMPAEDTVPGLLLMKRSPSIEQVGEVYIRHRQYPPML
ncbi:hypothetical protein FA95DRAFT_1598768 [Auriscalpium vulgare]|uniref:Uncharacterized protein n=1 Tax=Auriscalpium vulgare TaxID=40419 RepID=A0ACB8RCM4_9AGAM|nr:hypothetical protein FA95DRAFT_1598768 [Auriscalpium vulgare]